jgi:predicted nucleic acid-binding protein
VLVVDTSALLEALAGRSPDPSLIERLATDGDLHAPHLIDVEILHALRRLQSNDEITQERADDTRTDFADLVLARYPHHPLSDRIWELRHNISAYDATFVALAEALGAPLITCDARLAGTPNHDAEIEVYSSS